MTSSAAIQQCDYLNSHKLPHVFASEWAEVVYLNEQIRSLDSHISQLNALRRALHDRSCQLHNTVAPILTLPVEVLSYIFQQLIVGIDDFGLSFHCYQRRLRGALALSSVSSHFRRVAFATPDLWRSIPLCITDNEGIGNASSLLQHCTALASSVNVSVSNNLDEEEARSTVDILFTADVARKVKSFELYESVHASIWVDKLKETSFDMLDTLKVMIMQCADRQGYDFRSLKTLTRLELPDASLLRPVFMPPSLQHLYIGCATVKRLLSLLRQSLNLVGCHLHFESESTGDFGGDTQSIQPVTLRHLKRLSCNVFGVDDLSLLAEKVQLPSINTLELGCDNGDKLIRAIPLCRSVSATLTTLTVHIHSDTLEFDNLYQLCRLPFPKLQRLEFWSCYLESFLSAIHALALLDGEYSNPATHRIPALKFIKLRYGGDVSPHSLLDSLKEWRIGQAFHFHIQVDRVGLRHHAWSPDLRRELKSIVGERRIKIMWDDHWLV